MRRALLTIAGVVLGVATLGVHAQQQQLQLFARIVDSKGAPVATLEPGDVTIKENDVDTKVLKIDPTLFTDATYLANYPALAEFELRLAAAPGRPESGVRPAARLRDR